MENLVFMTRIQISTQKKCLNQKKRAITALFSNQTYKIGGVNLSG